MSIDRQMMDSIVRQHYEEIYRFCFSRMICKENVEDMVQSVFVLMQEKSGELTPENIRAWLYSVAQKKLLEEKRDEVRRSRFIRYEGDIAAQDPSQIYDMEDGYLSDGEMDTLKGRILNMLTPEERSLFEAIYEKHLRRKDVAEQLQITENALNVRLHRLRKHIRDLVRGVLMLMIMLYVKCR